MNQDDKRAQLCEMYFSPVRNTVCHNIPGTYDIEVQGEWTKIPISSGEYKETSGDVIEQELKATVTNTQNSFWALLQELLRNEGLLRLKFTNETEKIVGSDQFPVLLTTELSGSPTRLTVSFKRNSPEVAKIFKSF